MWKAKTGQRKVLVGLLLQVEIPFWLLPLSMDLLLQPFLAEHLICEVGQESSKQKISASPDLRVEGEVLFLSCLMNRPLHGRV